MNDVATRPGTWPSTPSSSMRDLDRLTAHLTNALQVHPGDYRRRVIPAERAPSDEQRGRLVARRGELRASLTATPGDAADEVILALIAGSPLFGLTDEEAAIKTGLYAEALADLPTWAIDRARRIFGKGGWRCPWDGRGCPSSAMIAAECRHILLPHQTELDRIEAILDAEPYDTGGSDTDRAREIDRWWNEVRPEVQREPGITQRTDEEISAERAEMARANERFRARERAVAGAEGRVQSMWGRLPISDELARQVGLAVPVAAPTMRAARSDGADA